MGKKGGNITIGLDIGTTKICAMAGQATDKGVDILSVHSCPSHGLRKGVVIDIEAAAHSIKKAISGISDHLGISIDEVHVGISGTHIKSLSSYGAIGIKGREVAPEDVERAIDSAGAVYVPLDREVLHVLPTDFMLDGQNGIKDPVGMTGVRLEVKVCIVTGAVTSVQNLLKCCERAGVQAVDVVLQPLASAEATLTDEERDAGIVLIDTGGGTTDIAVYKDGWLVHTTVLGIGGSHFTNDLSVGLRLPFNEAERIKKEHGSVLLADMSDVSVIETVAIDGQSRGIPKRYITEILHPRAKELVELIHRELQQVQEGGMSLAGAVLTGGSSLLTGFDRMAEAMLAMPVRTGYPANSPELPQVHNLRGEYNSPIFATGVGLVLYGAEPWSAPEPGGVIHTMSGWFKNILGKS